MTKTDIHTAYAGAYLVRGDANTLETVLDTLADDGVIERGSPDLFLRAYRKFGVDEAEDIRSRARTRPVQASQRVFAISTPSMTTESQNALLKTIEEPSADALFFFVVPSPEMLLPTVRSRAQMMEVDSKRLGQLVDAREFLAAAPQQRLEMLKPIYEHDEDEGRDMSLVISFLASLEREFAKESVSETKDEGLRSIYRARKYAGDKGSLLKALLEQVALLTPKI